MPTPCQPEISVIMPVFNGAAFLDRAVRSVCEQRFAAWELLAVDDGSGDDSYERLARWAAQEPRVRVTQLETNRGSSAARNQALRQARGDTIAYLDCDDEYYPTYLEQVSAWRSHADVLVFAYDIVEERPGRPDTGRTYAWDPGPVRTALEQACIVTPLGVAHRRDLLDRVGLFDEALHYEVDWDLWKRFAGAGASFLFVPLKSGRYHVRPDSQARTRRRPGAAG